MTDFRVRGDGAPVAALAFQHAAHFGVEVGLSGSHAPILVKHSSERKELFTRRMGHPRPVSEKPLPINEVVAHNLAVAMKQAKLSQASLAEKAGVSQKTVSNYLNPGQRQEGTSGKPASPKLVELESLGRALGMPVWKLTRPMSERERAMYEAIETAYLRLAEDAQAITSVSATDSGAMSAQQETRYAQDGKGDTALKRAGLPDLGGSDGADTKNRRASGAKGHRGS